MDTGGEGSHQAEGYGQIIGLLNQWTGTGNPEWLTATITDVKAKTQVWEKFGESMKMKGLSASDSSGRKYCRGGELARQYTQVA